MNKYIRATYSLDTDTQELLEQIAEQESEGERINESRTLRRMIREKASALGIFPIKKEKTAQAKERATSK